MKAAWRHGQLGVRMALAAAQHHSAPDDSQGGSRLSVPHARRCRGACCCWDAPGRDGGVRGGGVVRGASVPRRRHAVVGWQGG